MQHVYRPTIAYLTSGMHCSYPAVFKKFNHFTGGKNVGSLLIIFKNFTLILILIYFQNSFLNKNFDFIITLDLYFSELNSFVNSKGKSLKIEASFGVVTSIQHLFTYEKDLQQFYTDSGEEHVVEEERDGDDDQHQFARASASLQELDRLLAEQPHDGGLLRARC